MTPVEKVEEGLRALGVPLVEVDGRSTWDLQACSEEVRVQVVKLVATHLSLGELLKGLPSELVHIEPLVTREDVLHQLKNYAYARRSRLI